MTEIYRKPSLVVDIGIVNDGQILMIERGNEPFKGMPALPGGFVDYGEAVEDAAVRELQEETGIPIKKDWLNLVGVYSENGRDPREHVVSVLYGVFLGDMPIIRAGDDAKQAFWMPLEAAQNTELAFDHNEMVRDVALNTYRGSRYCPEYI